MTFIRGIRSRARDRPGRRLRRSVRHNSDYPIKNEGARATATCPANPRRLPPPYRRNRRDCPLRRPPRRHGRCAPKYRVPRRDSHTEREFPTRPAYVVNCYAIFSSGRLALIETGSGDYLQPTAGKLQRNLAAAGIGPADVEKVILTHLHPDHSAGLKIREPGRNCFRTLKWWCKRTSRPTGTITRRWQRQASVPKSYISNAHVSRSLLTTT